MKPITDKEKFPKFIVVNGVPESHSYNKYLIKPWKKGELVKVLPFEEQVSSVVTNNDFFLEVVL